MKRKIIACDLDDVLWDLMSSWVKSYNNQNGTNYRKEQFTDWDISKTLKDEHEKFFNVLSQDTFWDEHIKNIDNKTIKRNIECIKHLQKYYDFYITTNTDYRLKHKIDLFFNLYGEVIDNSHFIIIKDKWLLNVDIVIDDRAETLFEFDKRRIRCVKINQPWNYWFNCEGYNTFYELAQKLLEEVEN